jgi:hypothetical protein
MNLPDLISFALALDEKATKGPWEQVESYVDCPNEGELHRIAEIGPIKSCDGCPIAERNDSELIVNYRTAAPELARACQRLLEENGKLREVLEKNLCTYFRMREALSNGSPRRAERDT